MTKTKITHVRKRNEKGEYANLGGVTAAALIDENGVIQKLGFARCSDNDNFCRKTGREIAIGRMNANGPYNCEVPVTWFELCDFVHADGSDFNMYSLPHFSFPTPKQKKDDTVSKIVNQDIEPF
jgi:hypothetical protein